MAARESDIQALRNQLQASRWQLHDTIHRLEDQFNVPRRVKSVVAAHPMKWLALAAAMGLVAARATPWFRHARSTKWMRRLLSPAVQAAMIKALPASTRARGRGLSLPK
jgi:hypothetical protein